MRSIDARPNPKYFGRGRGATLLNLVTDHAVGVAGMVLSGTPRDSLHVIDLLYLQDGGTRPEVIPHARSHINVHGHYSCQPRTATALRPFDTTNNHELD